MLEPASFDYAVIRVVPRVEREEFLNAGVIVFCPQRRFLGVRVQLGEDRLRALWPGIDTDEIRRHVEAFVRVAEAAEDAGPIARLSQRERFHWLVAPRSTMVQVSAVHSGICEEPERSLWSLFAAMVDRAETEG